MEQIHVLVQVLFPSNKDVLCIPSFTLHHVELNWLKEQGMYLDFDDTMLVEYTYDRAHLLYVRSAVCRVSNGEYIDEK